MAAEKLQIRSNDQATKQHQISAQAFVDKWGPKGKAFRLGERAGAQAHFLDLCHLFGVATPDDPDSYCFEKGFRGIGSGRGYADVWKRGYFGWEYKAPGGDLGSALQQLVQYALPLENPPLLVVSDRIKTEVHTHFTGHPSTKTTFSIQDLLDPTARDLLRAVFTNPYHFKPGKTVQQLTEEAASTVAAIADHLRRRGVSAHAAAHFLTQCVFCFFADDAGLLPSDVFKRLVQKRVSPRSLQRSLTDLFAKMQAGGNFGVDDIPWFNGGLFQEIAVPELRELEVSILAKAASHNWRYIDAAIFGTLFERGLDPSKRSQLGAHYTDPGTIMKLLEPTILRPLTTEWGQSRAQISALLSKRDYLRVRAKGISSKSPTLKKRYAQLRTQANEAEREAEALFASFLHRLSSFRILDPACGSGNFLYMALKCLKDVEHLANVEAEQLGLQRQLPVTGPHNLLGIEVNEFASELAKVTVWIGELQWLREHGYQVSENPILQPLEHIQTRDALVERDGSVATWPPATVIVGNPPFLGDKRMRAILGNGYTDKLRASYTGLVPGSADLVCYWFQRAGQQIKDGHTECAGLVATNSIRQGTNRTVLADILKTAKIFDAWSDEPWINDGAAVRVSMICFGERDQSLSTQLNGLAVERIFADLDANRSKSGSLDLTQAGRLSENKGRSYFGLCLAGPFTVDGDTARSWLRLPKNPNGRSNADVIRPIRNGSDITTREKDRWVIDFGISMSDAEAALYEKPFKHVTTVVKPGRLQNNRKARAQYWWRHGETRPGLRSALSRVSRYIATSETAKHRVFIWLPTSVAPEHKLVVIPRDDDIFFGLLSSRFHVVWATYKGGRLGVGNDPVYSTASCFETFPFPDGMTPDVSAKEIRNPFATKVAKAAKELNQLRDKWLNPPEWTKVAPEVSPAYPPRVIAKRGFEKELGRRTLTNLYNEYPMWLANAHQALDRAVAGAYGWNDYSSDMPEAELLSRLLSLNLKRATS